VSVAKLSGLTQLSLVTLLCYDDAAAKKVRSLIDPKLFDAYWREIATAACDYHMDYGRVPGDHTADIIEALAARLPKRAQTYGELFDQIKLERETVNPDFVLDQASEFARYQCVNAGITAALDGLQKETAEGVREAVAALMRATKKSESVGAVDLKWRTQTEIDAIDIKLPEQFVEDELVARGWLTLIVAEPKTGKTAAGGNLAGAVALGADGMWLGSRFTGHKRPVLWLTAEGGLWMVQSRTRAMWGRDRIPSDCHVLAERPFPRLDAAQGLALLGRKVEAVGAGLVVIDPLSCFRDVADENDNAAAVAFADGIREFAEKYDVAVVMIHHPSKISTAEGATGGLGGGRGASALYGAVDVAISLLRDRRSDGVVAKFDKRYGRKIEDRLLRLNPETLVFDYVGPTGGGGRSVNEARAKHHAADFKAALTGEWQRKSQIIETMRCSDSTFRTRCSGWLAELGAAVQKRPGRPPHGEVEYRLVAGAASAPTTKRIVNDDEDD
jgi:hypothetical protein